MWPLACRLAHGRIPLGGAFGSPLHVLAPQPRHNLNLGRPREGEAKKEVVFEGSSGKNDDLADAFQTLTDHFRRCKGWHGGQVQRHPPS